MVQDVPMPRRLAIAAFVGIPVACATTPPGAPDAGVDGGNDVTMRDTFVPACIDVKACTDLQPSMGAQCILSFDAQLVDVMGAPISGETLYFCGINICTPP